MKAYVSDYNNILLELRERVELTKNPREADVLILWQDVRSGNKEICDINRDYVGKPVVVVQHGRGATRDYLPPNSFPLMADKICVWGEKEADRIIKAGYPQKVAITGSPLINCVKQYERKTNPETFVVFTPVITSHEEPDNLEVYFELKKIEYSYVQKRIREHKSRLKEEWHSWVLNENCATERQIPYDLLRKDFYLISKLTSVHDQALYFGPVIKTEQFNRVHIQNSLKVLQNASCVVGLEEGTFQLMATAMGIPTIIVDGFEYGEYGGIKDYKTEIIRSKASAFCGLSDLKETIESELSNPNLRANDRLDVIREEFGDMNSDPVENIIEVACNLAQGDIRKPQDSTNHKEELHGEILHR